MIQRISGRVVECIVAIDVTWVQAPDDVSADFNMWLSLLKRIQCSQFELHFE